MNAIIDKSDAITTELLDHGADPDIQDRVGACSGDMSGEGVNG